MQLSGVVCFSSALRMCVDTKFTPLRPSNNQRELWRTEPSGKVILAR